MSDDTSKIRRKLSALTNSLDVLESNLAPLLSQSLPELVLGLDVIQQAKLQVVIPYLVYDLVFVHLKTRGLDPKTHPIIAELDRVRQYFDKIRDTEDPAKRQHTIDKAAATRFIKHAIAQAKDTTPANFSSPATHIRFNDNDNDGGGGTPHDVRIRVPAKVTEKMLEREKYHEMLREEAPASEDGGDLEVIDDEGEPDGSMDTPPASEEDVSSSPHQVPEFDAGENGKGNVKTVAVGNTSISHVHPPPPSEAAAEKRRRPSMDPFAGYGDGPTCPSVTETGSTPNASRSGAKVRKIHVEQVSAEASSGTNTPSSGGHHRVKNLRKRSQKRAGPMN